MRLTPLACLAVTLLLSIGCSQYEKRTFTIEVKNNSARPVTLGLVKVGPPWEVQWESPADRAIMDPGNTGIGWGTLLQPGKTAYIDTVTALFAPRTVAYLRVYTGALSLTDMLAISPESRNRHDIRLREGRSIFSITDRGPFHDIQATSYTPTGEAAKQLPTIRTSP
jgi:hypothetical protein